MWIQQYCLAYFKQTFSPNLMLFFFLFLGGILCFGYTAVTEKPSRLRSSYRFTLQTVFSLWKGETELGLLTAGNRGFWCRLRAGNDGNCSCNERPSKKQKENTEQKKGKTDMRHVKHYQPHPLLCKSMLK